MVDEEAAVYRLYDAEGQLLYVGMTGNLGVRYAEHRRDKPWWSEVARRSATWYPSRKEALAVERLAIRDEGPKYNKRGAEDEAEKAAQRLRGKVSQDAYQLRRKTMWSCIEDGLSWADARREGRAAERAYKAASGVFRHPI